MNEPDGIMLTMQNSAPGRAADHRQWYLTRHLPDVCSVPGILSGAFTALAAPQGDEPWAMAGVYRLAGDPVAVVGAVLAEAGAGRWELSDALDGASLLMVGGEALTGRVRSPHGPDATGADRLLYIVLTNCTPGDDAAFNAWYSNRHLPDVLDVPGFVAAQRFRLMDHPALPASPYRYCAIYEVRADEAAKAFAELQARAGTERMVLSPTLDTSGVHAQAFAVLREEFVQTAA